IVVEADYSANGIDDPFDTRFSQLPKVLDINPIAVRVHYEIGVDVILRFREIRTVVGVIDHHSVWISCYAIRRAVRAYLHLTSVFDEASVGRATFEDWNSYSGQ